MVPDCCGTGFDLTPFGRLVFGPWQVNFDRYNEAVSFDGKEISSIGKQFTTKQKDFVFELLQDGSVKFWNKGDYDSSLMARTSTDTQGVKTTTNEPVNENAIKKVHKSGSWKANFQDSTVEIGFGNEADGIPGLKGKYKNLGSAYLDFQQISYFDSVYLGGRKTLKRVITIHYEHPWVNKF
jgi:hypothetical protein